MRNFLFFLFFLLTSNIVVAQKPRVIHLIDIGKYPHLPEIDKKDPDDRQSLVRALLYANEMEIEGLIATASWAGKSSSENQQGSFPESIKATVNAYGKAYDNLKIHDQGWPTAEYLHSVIKRGNPAVSIPYWSGDHMDVVGDTKDTEASDHILSRILDSDTRNLWFSVWGKSIDLAQALFKLKRDYPSRVEELTGKIFVYDIAGQDACGAWITGKFPRIKWYRAMNNVISWANVLASIDNIGDLSVISIDWWERHVRGVGTMGELYPIKTHEGNWEGDTPSFLPFTDRGLSDPENLHYGGWGGRYMQNPTRNMPALNPGINRFQKKYEPFLMYEPAGDTWCYNGNIYFNDSRVPIGRFRTAIQNDFAARMQWTVNSDYSNANHPPVAIINDNPGRNFVYLSVAPGEKVYLTARGSSDPDGDNLSFQWWRYAEADSYDGNINIHNTTSQDASFIAPNAPGKNIHIILEITDHGSPRLTSYRRLIIAIDR
jgi:hypothetical protein